MAVNEDLSAYSTTAASNTPGGSDNIGTDLDDHLRDIKRNIKRVGRHFLGSTAPELVNGVVWYDSSGTASDNVTDLRIYDGGWISLFRVDTSADVAYALADPTLYASTATTLTAGAGISGGGTLAGNRSFSLANFSNELSATANWSMGGGRITTDPYGRVISATQGATVASALDMEDRSSTAVYVTPVRMKDHLGVAKFWVAFDGSGTASVTASYNVASVVRSATGTYTINFSTGFVNTNYNVTGNCFDVAASLRIMHPSALATGSCQIKVRGASTSVEDADKAFIQGYGYHST
jgi:hypothetical protein